MNKAIEILTHEHNIIIAALGQVKGLFKELRQGNECYYEIKKSMEFFRVYADNYHHAKEENVLFPEMIRRREMLEFGVIYEMNQNHEDFREMLSKMEDCLDEAEWELAQKTFEKYAESLLEHIAVENEEVFQIAETIMTEDELLSIYYRFQDCDRELGDAEKQEWEDSFLK
ncbi:MAG: hemerythrin domain-containing protein [Saprospiraceae bacterium]|jgi:hemerythrin-like domain-containing protein